MILNIYSGLFVFTIPDINSLYSLFVTASVILFCIWNISSWYLSFGLSAMSLHQSAPSAFIIILSILFSLYFVPIAISTNLLKYFALFVVAIICLFFTLKSLLYLFSNPSWIIPIFISLFSFFPFLFALFFFLFCFDIYIPSASSYIIFCSFSPSIYPFSYNFNFSFSNFSICFSEKSINIFLAIVCVILTFVVSLIVSAVFLYDFSIASFITISTILCEYCPEYPSSKYMSSKYTILVSPFRFNLYRLR